MNDSKTEFSIRNVLIGLAIFLVTLLVLRLAFRIGFILLVLGLGVYLGYRWRLKQKSRW